MMFTCVNECYKNRITIPYVYELLNCSNVYSLWAIYNYLPNTKLLFEKGKKITAQL